MRARRAVLYMPGDDQRKISKATTLNVDCICMDMEDGVAINRKVDARKVIRQALENLDFGRAERMIRINAIGSGLEQEDLANVAPGKPDSVVVPKVESGEQLKWVSRELARLEQEQGWQVGCIELIAVVETAKGIINLREIASAEARLSALIFGAEDLAGDIGARRTRAGWEVFTARSLVILHAAVNQLQAIDMVFVDFHDSAGLEAESTQGAQLGFSGKQVIHPNQVEIVQSAFTPDDQAITYALRLVREFDIHQQAGRGAFALDGKMVDAPVIKAAERVLALARAAGKLPNTES